MPAPGPAGRRRGKRRSPPPPTLAWAKWIEALGEESVRPIEGDDELLAALHVQEEDERLATLRPRDEDERLATHHGQLEAAPIELSPPAEPVPPAEPMPATEPVPAAEPCPEPAPEPSSPPFLEDSLPASYGEDRIGLLCKDPYWLHAYWETTERGRRAAADILGHAPSRLTLRIRLSPGSDDGEPAGFFDIDVPNLEARHWYVHVGRPGTRFEAEIGLRSEDGRFAAIARSRAVTTPRDRVSDVLDEQWTDLSAKLTRDVLLPGPRPGGDSLAVPELARGWRSQLAGSEAVSSFGSEAVSSFGLREERGRRPFWFVLGTELTIYGATEPGAQVSCQGHPVRLRPDGTFTLRFALPDGARLIPCAATAPDGSATIIITPSIEKQTSEERLQSPAAAREPAVILDVEPPASRRRSSILSATARAPLAAPPPDVP